MVMRLLERLLDRFSTDSDNRPPIPPKQAYNILRNDRRCRVIEYLDDYEVGAEVEVRELADYLAENGDRKACYVSLIQSHLYALDPTEQRGEVRLVEYDDMSKTVAVRPELHTIYDAHRAFVKELD